ncbi:MAG: glycosyltransferase family 4 protein [Candidatus Brocadiia bacterium]
MLQIKTLHVIALDYPGGVETLFCDWLEASQGGNLENHVLLTRGRAHPWFRDRLAKYAASVSHVKYLGPFKLPRRPRFLRRSHLRSSVSRVQPDIFLIYNSLGNLSLLRGAAHACPTAKKIHYEHGGAWTDHNVEEVANYFDRMEGVICNSYATQRVLELAWDCPTGLARVCRNGVRLPAPDRGHIPQELPLDGPLRIGFAGRLIPHKAPVLLLHVLAALRETSERFELLVAGSGPEEEKMRKTAARLGLSDYVRFCGPVENMPALYSRINVLVCPSVREPLGNVVIEASFYGCPVVAAAVDGIPEVVMDSETGRLVPPALAVESYVDMGGSQGGMPRFFYDPAADDLAAPRLCNPEHMAQAVRQVCRDADDYRRMSAKANERITQEFSLTGYVNNLQEELQQIAQT